MSNQTFRQRKGIARYQEIERMGRQRAHVAEWVATARTPSPALTVVPTPKPTAWDRLAAAGWRLHDGMPLVWALIGAIVLTASTAACVAIAAMALGWRP